MICEFEDNSPRRLETPIEVRCINCNATYRVRLFPLRAECGASDMREYMEHVASTTTGLGDVVASIIKVATLGMLKPSEGCGCDGRKQALNQLWSWRTDASQSGDAHLPS
jgi:hypothetical protein